MPSPFPFHGWLSPFPDHRISTCLSLSLSLSLSPIIHPRPEFQSSAVDGHWPHRRCAADCCARNAELGRLSRSHTNTDRPTGTARRRRERSRPPSFPPPPPFYSFHARRPSAAAPKIARPSSVFGPKRRRDGRARAHFSGRLRTRMGTGAGGRTRTRTVIPPGGARARVVASVFLGPVWWLLLCICGEKVPYESQEARARGETEWKGEESFYSVSG